MGWRPALASALAGVVGQPSLWLIGSLSFALRGGLLLLLASMVVLPTPIELRMLLGSNLGSSGFTPQFLLLLTVAGLLLGVLVLLTQALVAYLELSAFERLLRGPDMADELSGRPFTPPDRRTRRWLLVTLLGLQLLVLGGVIVAAIPLINGIVTLAYQEVIRPSLGGTIYVRLFNGVRDEVFVLLAGLVVVELVSSVATRRLLLRGYGLTARPPATGVLASLAALIQALGGGLLRPLRRPLRTLATLVLVWALSLAAVVPLSWGLKVAWSSVRGAYLGPAWGSRPDELAGLAVVTLALCGIWVAAVLLGGFVSALRAALWSADALR